MGSKRDMGCYGFLVLCANRRYDRILGVCVTSFIVVDAHVGFCGTSSEKYLCCGHLQISHEPIS